MRILLLFLSFFFFLNAKAQVKKDSINTNNYCMNNYFQKSGELLKKSAMIQGLSLSFYALSGASAYWVSTQKEKVWALPIMLGCAGLTFNIYSINLKSKSGKMLVIGAEANSLKAKINF